MTLVTLQRQIGNDISFSTVVVNGEVGNWYLQMLQNAGTSGNVVIMNTVTIEDNLDVAMDIDKHSNNIICI